MNEQQNLALIFSQRQLQQSNNTSQVPVVNTNNLPIDHMALSYFAAIGCGMFFVLMLCANITIYMCVSDASRQKSPCLPFLGQLLGLAGAIVSTIYIAADLYNNQKYSSDPQDNQSIVTAYSIAIGFVLSGVMPLAGFGLGVGINEQYDHCKTEKEANAAVRRLRYDLSMT